MGISKGLVGFPKKLAKIVMTRLHPLLPKYNSLKRGLKMGGYVTRGGVTFRLQVEIQEKTDSIPTKDSGPLLTIRRYSARGEGKGDVYEIVSRVRDEST